MLQMSRATSMGWLLLPATLFYYCCSTEGVVLHSRLGDLEGKELTTPNGRAYYSFTSIPYAKPPLGTLRLKNPVPYGKWPGRLDATKPAPMCMQIFTFLEALRNITSGQEDCLYLNVYTPTTDRGRKLPVLIYVHGGGLRCGSEGPPEFQTKFMEEDVVLVSVHYRLGVLGFLSNEDDEIPGNFGLKDQALAVKWVYENIEDFGGDKSLLVVFGNSAGGACSHYLIISPLSRDYLQAGIAQSGVVGAPWSLAPPGRARRYSKRLGELLGCEIEDGFLDCLQKIEANQLVRSAEEEFRVWDFDPAVVFQPVIEVKNDGAFITEDPRNIKVKKTLIAGVVPGEGFLKSSGLKVREDNDLLEEFVNNIDKCLEAILLVDEYSYPRASVFINAVKARYFKNLSTREDIIQGLEDLYRDYFFVYPWHLALQKHSGPKYSYIFHHRGEGSYVELLNGGNKLNTKVPCHGDELFSLFNFKKDFPHLKGRPEDSEISKRLVKMWINVSKHRNPTPEGSPVVWEKYSNGNVFHIRTKNDEMGTHDWGEAIDFWTTTSRIITPQKLDKTEL